MSKMTVVLYRPDQHPLTVESAGFITHSKSGEIVQDTARAAELLDCDPGLVDVLACGSGYLIYSVFDYEGEVNEGATAVFSEITGIVLSSADDEVLRGPVLVVLA